MTNKTSYVHQDNIGRMLFGILLLLTLTLLSSNSRIASAATDGWQEGFNLPGLSSTVNAVTADSAGNIYASIYGDSQSGDNFFKWDGSSWSSLGAGPIYHDPYSNYYGAYTYATEMVVDSTGNLYVAGYFEDDSYYETFGFVAQWNGVEWIDIIKFDDSDSEVMGMAINSDDHLVIGGGWYQPIAGVPNTGNIAMWDGANWSAVGDGLSSAVRSLAFDSNGLLYASGYFEDAGGDSDADALAVWDGVNWGAVGSGGVSLYGSVETLTVDANDNLFVSGYFTSMGGTTATNIAKWDGTQWMALGSGLNSYAQALTVDGSGDLYAAGYFDIDGNTNVRLAKWDGNNWSAVADFDSSIYLNTLSVASDGYLIVGGWIPTLSGATINHIAKWDGNSWNRFGDGNGINSSVQTLIRDQSGNIYASGYFSSAGDTPANRIAMWDGTQWHALGSGLNHYVNALAFDSQGNLYAGGWFTEAGGSSANYVAKWDGTSWSALGTGLNQAVFALAVDGNDHLYVGGQFTQAGGQSISRIAKWDGNSWGAVSGGLSSTVRALTFDSNSGDLYAGGYFTGGVARWNGASWSTLPGTTSSVNKLFFGSDGNLYVGGRATFDNLNAERLLKWDGNAWTDIAQGYVSVSALVEDDNGNLLAGGYFSNAATISDGYAIAQWDGSNLSVHSSFTGNVYMSSLVSDGNGGFFMGGSFSRIGDVLSHNIARYGSAITINTPPNATDDQYTTVEDTTVSGNVISDDTGNGVDSDVDGDPLTIDSHTNPVTGSLTLESSGVYTYTPALNASGVVTFTYVLTDGEALSNSATVSITVTVENDAPVAADNAYSMIVDDILTGNILTDDTGDGVDSDIEGDALSVANAGLHDTANGRVSLSTDGAFFYQPDGSYIGDDTFSYILSDGVLTDTATVTVSVSAEPPTTVNVELPSAGWNLFGYPLQQNQAVGDALTSIDGEYTIVWGYDAGDATPWEGYNTAAPTWANDLQDLKVGRGYWITVTQPTTITFSSANGRSVPTSAPAYRGAMPNPPAAYYGTAVEAGLLVEAWIGDTLCGQAMTENVGGEVVYVLHVASADETTGCGFTNASITLTVNGAAAATTVWNATTYHELNLDNSVPTAVTLTQHDADASATLWTTLAIDLVALLTLVVVVRSRSRLRVVAVSLALPIMLLAALPAFALVPQQPHRIYGEFSVSNAAAGEKVWTVVASADNIPIASYQVTTTGSATTTYVFDIPADDPDTPTIEGATNGQTISFIADGATVPATRTFSSGSFEQFDLTGNVAATGGVDENGNTTIDLGGENVGAGVTVVYSPTLNALVITNPNGTLTAGGGATQLNGNSIAIPLANIAGNVTLTGGSENSPFIIDLTEGSPFPPGTTVIVDGGGGENQLTLVGVQPSENSTHNPTSPTSGAITVGGVTYQYSNVGAVTTTGTGGGFETTLPETNEVITLNGSNGNNTLAGSTVPTNSFGAPAEGSNVTLNLGGGDDTVKIASGSFQTNTTLIINGGNGTDTVTWEATGRIVSGTMALRVSAENLLFTNGSILPITIGNGGNDKITTTDPTTVTIESGVTLDIDLAPDFVYTKGTTITLIDNQNPNSTVSGTFAGLPEGAPVIIDGHTFYISYQGGDGNDVVLVTENNIVSQPGTASGDEDGTVSGNVLAGAAESYGRNLTAVLVENVSNGSLTLNPDGSFVYTPTVDFFGTVTFTYAATDGRDTGEPTTVTITVNPTTDPPTPSDDSYTMLVNTTLSGNVISDDTGNGADVDVDLDVLTVASSGFMMTDNGMVSLATDGTFFYLPNSDFVGTDTFTYTVTDGLYSEIATVMVEVEFKIVNAQLPTAGWNLFSYPIVETKTVADALVSIDGKYQTVWGFDNTNRVWQGYDVSIPAMADLAELQLGQAYWITVTEPVTIAFTTTHVRSTSAAPRGARSAANLPTPPAAFYGAVDVPLGTTATATIGDTVCATGETFRFNNVTYYKLYVLSADERPNCGKPGAMVTISIEGAAATQSGKWQQGVFRELHFTPNIPTAIALQSQGVVNGHTALLTVLAAITVLTGLLVDRVRRLRHR